MTSPIKTNLATQFKLKLMQCISVGIMLFSACAANAAVTDLGTAPLVSATTGDVLPNLMYILDNSGSMKSNYMPDYVNDSNKCKTTGTATATANNFFTSSCQFGDPAYNTRDFNSIYYNPEITYTPGVNADGSLKTAMNSANTAGWTSVPIDAYGVYSTSNTTLVPTSSTAGYPDRVWCNTNSASTANLSDPLVCRKNTQYIYPNNTGTTSTSFNQPYTAPGYPYYYTVAAGEYCTDKNLTSCITATTPTATNTFPAKLRWCTSNTNVASATGTGCQAKYNETTGHTYTRWAGIATSTSGKIKINADTLGCGVAGTPSCAAPSAMSITGITVNGVSIILPPGTTLSITDTTSATQRSNLARAIRDAINAHVSAPDDFTATYAGDEVTIQPVSGAALTGTIALTFSASPTVVAVSGVAATGSFNVTGANQNVNARITNVKVNGVEIMASGSGSCGSATSNSSSGTASTRYNLLAVQIANRINSCNTNPEYTATVSGATVNVASTAAAGASGNGAFNITGFSNGASVGSINNMANGANGVSGKTYSIPRTIAQFTGGTKVVTTFNRVDIEPFTTTYPKAGTRTDCVAAATCTYDEEMTNFANWYSYYSTRMQMMKTSTSHAFKTIDNRYRVGFITINNASTYYLPVAPFGATQKASWYNKLFTADGSSGTPLRSALTTVGRIFAGKNPISGFTADPVQFSCQQNFSILTTDGYWNTDLDTNVRNVDNTGSVGNRDGGTTPRPMFEGPTAVSNSLADAAKYYYDTDLRTSALSNCTGSTRPNGTTGDVCQNNVFVTSTDNNLKQHMTTFTLGLGVDASLTYTSDYKSADEGDFYELTQGTRSWPVPAANSQTAVDDLWHAAVNGQGTYFSAKDPNQLADSLSQALSGIKAKVGAGAAAATSTLNPVSGDNFTYVASYTSVKWIGNLEARTVNTNTGKVSEDATWCVENVLSDTCATAPVELTVSGNTTYQCVTPSATIATCASPGVFDSVANTCSVEISSSCRGTLRDLVSDTVDTRNIYMNVNGALGSFTRTNLATVGKDTNFSNAFLATNLSQWSSLTTAQRTSVNSTSMVNFLRGNNGYEDRSSNVNGTVDDRLYRFRETTLGDLVDSTPVYVGAPKANFADPKYGPDTSVGSFKTTQATRAGTIYIGANDGMLHAINATTGVERWAYVPTMVLNNMWKLADSNYGNGVDHSYFVDGDIVVNDVCTANCTSTSNAVWKTILVAGLNGGGKGYFALDITSPTSPILLWEFDPTDSADDNDIGYSYGNPIITKKADGTWVVLVTSGYNNITGGNPGKGFLYVLNASTGAVISKYGTGVGSATTPSGFAKINAFIRDAEVNNQAEFVYGGDLLGNVWRIDINSSQSATNPFKVAVLKDSGGNTQPITVRPELAEINGKKVLYVGTGKYLGTSDLTDTQQQTIYAISDDAAVSPTTLDNPRSSSLMVSQILVNSTTTATRTVQQPANAVDFNTGRGWYIDFPDSGERQNVPAQLVFGTLLLPTTVPSNTVCSPGGTGWLNFLDYKTGASAPGAIVASKTNAPIVGMNILYIKGKPVVNIVTADNPTPQFPPNQPTFENSNASGFTNHRVIWRELIDEQ